MYNPSSNPADHPFPATLPAPVDHWLRTRTTNVPAQLIVNWALASLIIAVSNSQAEHLNARASALRYLIEIQSTHFKARILAA